MIAAAVAQWVPLPGASLDALEPPPGALRPVRLGDWPVLSRRAPAVVEMFAGTLGLANDSDALHGFLAQQADPPVEQIAFAVWLLCSPWQTPIATDGQVAKWWRRFPEQQRAAIASAVVPHLLGSLSPALLMEPPRAPGPQTEVLFVADDLEDGLGWWVELVGTLTADLTHDLGRTLAMTTPEAVLWRNFLRRRAGWSLVGKGYVRQQFESASA